MVHGIEHGGYSVAVRGLRDALAYLDDGSDANINQLPLIPCVILLVKTGQTKELIGFSISASIEIVQMFGCGATDINDLITNTVGACLGFCIYRVLYKIIPGSWPEKIQADGSQCLYELVIFWMCTLLIMITIQPQMYHVLFSVGGAGGEIQMWE